MSNPFSSCTDFENKEPWEHYRSVAMHSLVHTNCCLSVHPSVECFEDFLRNNTSTDYVVHSGVNISVYNNFAKQVYSSMTFRINDTNSFNLTDDNALSSACPDTSSLIAHLAAQPHIKPSLGNELFDLAKAEQTLAQSLSPIAELIKPNIPFQPILLVWEVPIFYWIPTFVIIANDSEPGCGPSLSLEPFLGPVQPEVRRAPVFERSITHVDSLV